MEELRMNFFIQSEKRLSEKQVLDVMGYQGRIIAKQKKKQAGKPVGFYFFKASKQTSNKQVNLLGNKRIKKHQLCQN